MRVLVPFDNRNPKTRLSPVLTESERRAFARVMLDDVVATIRDAGPTPTVLSPTELDIADATVRVDDRSLTVAVNDALDSAAEPTAVVMGDLPLATTTALNTLFNASGDVVLARGLGGGTNALLARHPAFEVSYHGTSYLDHLAIAESSGLTVSEVDSYRLAVDVDEPDDLSEVLIHGDGRSAEWLRQSGFGCGGDEGRPSVSVPTTSATHR